MPTPRPNETKDEYMSRCMGDGQMQQEFPEGDQRYAVCQAKWDDKKKGSMIVKTNYPRIAKLIYQTPWMVLPATLESIRQQFEAHDKSALIPMPMDDEDEDEMPMDEMPMDEQKKVAVLYVDGIIGKHLGMLETMCGGFDLDQLNEQLDEVSEDDSIETVVLYFNTPGGSVVGVPETADKIAELAKKKRCIAYTDMLCASAGYYMASQANAVYCSVSSTLGSVGVYSIYLDESRALENAGIKINAISAGSHKLDGASFTPMTEQVRAEFQKDVDRIYAEFKSAVNSKRTIKDEDLQGQVFDGVTAVERGFADGNIHSLKELLAALTETKKDKDKE